jgi:hypothetical protein
LEEISCKECAIKYSVSKHCIYKIVEGKTWNENKLSKQELVKEFLR